MHVGFDEVATEVLGQVIFGDLANERQAHAEGEEIGGRGKLGEQPIAVMPDSVDRSRFARMAEDGGRRLTLVESGDASIVDGSSDAPAHAGVDDNEDDLACEGVGVVGRGAVLGIVDLLAKAKRAQRLFDHAEASNGDDARPT